MIPTRLRRIYYRGLAHLAWRRLRKLSGQALLAGGEAAALRAFHRAAKRVPAYRRLLEQSDVDAREVADAPAFRRLVPITNKEVVFANSDLSSLCLDGRVGNVACVYTSSGYSGTFSFGLETERDLRGGRRALDLLLEMYLHVTSCPTLLINALPMGVQVNASLPVKFDASVRADSILAVVRKLAGACGQVVIVGEHPFLKKVIDDGLDAGMDWPTYRVSLVTGAEVMPENFRRYVGAILGHGRADPSRGRVFVSVGVSELGLTIGHETDDCAGIRSAAADDDAIRTALFPEAPFVPTLVQYLPRRFHLETPVSDVGRSHLVVTTTDPARRLPLIRYATGDWARLLTHAEVRDALAACGRQDLAPRTELPFLALWGRGRSLTVAGREVFPEQIKEAIYSDAAVASATTANFRMEAVEGRLRVALQLRAGRTTSASLRDALKDATRKWTGMPVDADLVPFAQFPNALDLCYQRKFRYL
jgi:phenylacetate-CoA ligase